MHIFVKIQNDEQRTESCRVELRGIKRQKVSRQNTQAAKIVGPGLDRKLTFVRIFGECNQIKWVMYIRPKKPSARTIATCEGTSDNR